VISFRVYGDPKGQPRPKAFARGGHAAVYDPGTAEGWKSLVAMAAKEVIPATPLTGPLQVDIEFYFKRPKSHFGSKKGVPYLKDFAPYWYTRKPDRDNLDKAVLDALTQLGVWEDDQQVVAGTIVKRYILGPEKPGATITIKTLRNGN